MSGLLSFLTGGAGHSAQQDITGSVVQSSIYGLPIPVVYGYARIGGNLIHLPSDPVKSTSSSGGKLARSKGAGTTTDIYTAPVMIGLCEGPLASTFFSPAILRVWADKDLVTTFAATYGPNGWGILPGDPGQAAWSFLTTNVPAQALGYQYLALVCNAAIDLPGYHLRNYSWEVKGLKPFAATNDALGSDILADILTDVNHGFGWIPFGASGSLIGDLTLYADYCAASGLLVSPAYTSQKAAVAQLQELLDATNSAAVWSDGLLKVVPFGDAALSGNGHTYTPDVTPLYDLTDDDYITAAGADPVILTRKPDVEAFNQIFVEFEDRANEYNPSTAEAKDDASIQAIAATTGDLGIRPAPKVSLPLIKDAGTARLLAQLRLQREQNVRNEYRCTVGMRYSLLEPMDLITLTDANLGLVLTPVRVVEVTERAGDEGIDLLCEDWPFGTATATAYPHASGAGSGGQATIDPGDTTTPIIFDGPQALASSPLEIWIAASGGPAWGGCEIWISTDDVTFYKVGLITQKAVYGALAASLATNAPLPVVDATHTLAVDLAASSGGLVSVSAADFAALMSLCYVDGEFLAFETAALMSAFHYDLTTLGRGAYASPIATHGIGTAFVLCDQSVFRLPWPQGTLGQTLYFKFPAFNQYGGALQDLAGVSSQPFVVGSVPDVPPLLPLTMRVERYSLTGNDIVVRVYVADQSPQGSGNVSIAAAVSGGATVASSPQTIACTSTTSDLATTGYASFTITRGSAPGRVGFTATAYDRTQATDAMDVEQDPLTIGAASPPSCYIMQGSDDEFTEDILLNGYIGDGATGALAWSYQIAAATPVTGSGGFPFTITVPRLPKQAKKITLVVAQSDGQTAEASYNVLGRLASTTDTAHGTGTATGRTSEDDARANVGGMSLPHGRIFTDPIYNEAGDTALIDSALGQITTALDYPTGHPIHALEPGEAGANVTETRTSNNTGNVDSVSAVTARRGSVKGDTAIDSGNVVVAASADFSRSYTGKHLGNLPDDAGSNRNAGTANQITGGGRGYSVIDSGLLVVASGVDFARSFLNKHLGNVPDDAGSDRRSATAVQKTGGDRGAAALDSGNSIVAASVDFARGFLNKHLGNVPDDAGSDRRSATATQKTGGDRGAAALDSGNVLLAGSGDFSRAYTGKHIGNIPDDGASDRNAVSANQRTGGGRGYSVIDSGLLVVAGGIDLARSFLNKHLGNIPDDVTSDRRASTANQKTGGDRGAAAIDSGNVVVAAAVDLARGYAGRNLVNIADDVTGDRRGATANEKLGGARIQPVVDAGGVILAAGVDLARAYTGKHLGNIPDDVASDRRSATAVQKTGADRGYTALDSSNKLVTGVTAAATAADGVAGIESGRGANLKGARQGGHTGGRFTDDLARGGDGGMAVPQGVLHAGTIYDATGGAPLIDPLTKTIQSALLMPNGTASDVAERGSNKGDAAFDLGPNLYQAVMQYDNPSAATLNKRALKGYQSGTGYNGLAITFPVAFQQPPMVRLSAGVSTIYHQPDATKWAPGYTATLAQILDLYAAALGPTGFTIHAQLRQKGGATASLQDFGGGNVTAINTPQQIAMTANAPSGSGHYNVSYRATITTTTTPPHARTATVVIEIRKRAGGSTGTPTSLRTDTYTVTDPDGTGPYTYDSGMLSFDVTASLANGDYIEVIATSFTSSGSSGTSTFTLHGAVNSADSVRGLTYQYGAADNAADMTLDHTYDTIKWEAWSWQ